MSTVARIHHKIAYMNAKWSACWMHAIAPCIFFRSWTIRHACAAYRSKTAYGKWFERSQWNRTPRIIADVSRAAGISPTTRPCRWRRYSGRQKLSRRRASTFKRWLHWAFISPDPIIASTTEVRPLASRTFCVSQESHSASSYLLVYKLVLLVIGDMFCL